MNAAIASASLLGFGDKPASEAMSSFAKTLEKIYNSQSATSKQEEKSRADAIAKYNEQERDKKKKRSDFEDFLKKMKGDKEGEGEGEKKKKKGGMGLLGILGITAIGGAALTAFAPMIINKLGEMLLNTLKSKVKEMVDEIVDAVEAPIKEKFEEIKEGWNGIVEFVKEKLGLEEEEVEPEMASFGENYKEQELALARAAEESRNKAPAEAVAETVTPPEGSPEAPDAPAAEIVKVVSKEESGSGKTQAKNIESNVSNNERYKIIYDAAKKQGDPIPELTAAQAMFESNYLKSILAVEGNNPFGQSGKGDAGQVDYKNASIVSTTTGWAKYSSLEAAIAARIKRWSKKTPQGNKGYGEYSTPMSAMEGIMENYAPAKDANNHSHYLGGVERIMRENGHDPHRKIQKLQKGGEVKAPKDKNDPRTKLGVMENRNFEVKSPLLQGKKKKVQKRQKGGLVLFAGHADVPIGHSQPGTDAPGTPLEGKYKPTAEQHFAKEVGAATQALAKKKNVPISYRPARGRYASTSDPNSNWAQITQIRSQGGSAIDLHFDAYGYDKGKLIVGSRGVIANGFNLSSIEKEIQSKFGRHPSGTRFEVPILELDPINKAPGNSQTYAQMIVDAVQKANGGETSETTTETTETTETITEVPQGSAGGARGTNPPKLSTTETTTEEEEEEETNVTGVEAVLKAAEENIGIGAGQSMQCANTTRQVLRAAGHPDADKTTKTGDLDPEGLKYSGPDNAASFAGTDMGTIKESKTALVPGDIVLWKNTFSAMGGNIPGAITHVGIKGEGNDVYDHGSGPGWRKRAMWDGGHFAYGVGLSGTGKAKGGEPTSELDSIESGAFDFGSLGIGSMDFGSMASGIDGMLSGLINDVLGPILSVIAGIAGAALFGSPAQAATSDTGANYLSGGDGGGVPTMTGGLGAASVSDPNARALLNAIADAEGTTNYANNGYNTMFTGKQFKNMEDHPRQIQNGGGHSSDAAGRYQFLSTTWDEYANGRSMSPENQDQVALELVANKRGVNISDGLSKDEIYKLGQEWASIEGGAAGVPGGSYNGQAKFSADKFMSMYEGYGGKPQKLQQGGTVGGQINTGTMKGIQNSNMAKLKEMSAQMKKVGPKVIRVQAPPVEIPPTMTGGGGGGGTPVYGDSMSMSELADYMSRVSMGALT